MPGGGWAPSAPPAGPIAAPPVVSVPRSMPPLGGGGALNRKAVLVGCSYRGTSAELKGCTNDVQCMSYALKKVRILPRGCNNACSPRFINRRGACLKIRLRHTGTSLTDTPVV